MREVRSRYPDVIFLSEAFTRPKVMKSLAKLGFSQSYTYFTWRTTKAELQEYLSEITGHPERDFFRPNFFVTTPDILPVQLQTGEVWMFKSRAALAALMSANYGIYNGYELIEHEPIPGREEYLNSEKYEIKTRNWNAPGNIKDYFKQLNTIRRQNSALQQTNDLRFLQVDNDNVTGFLKEDADGSNAVACAISLSGEQQTFWLHFGEHLIGPPGNKRPVRTLENLVTGERRMLEWGGTRLRIDPSSDPAVIFRCHA
jgi:starch synthase (maltosyl-transferring)